MISVQYAVGRRGIPSARSLKRYAASALSKATGEITLRVVGEKESRSLNRRYRGKDKATNVLSFSSSPTPDPRLPTPAVSGDLLLCAPVIAREARAQRKSPAAHWAHMVVHGVLHLQGLDHIKSSEARVMEAKERAILAGLSFPDPYFLS